MCEWFLCLRRKNKLKTSRAQGMVEFAIILPVLLVALFVIIEFGRLFHAWLVVENGASAVTDEEKVDPARLPAQYFVLDLLRPASKLRPNGVAGTPLDLAEHRGSIPFREFMLDLILQRLDPVRIRVIA